LLKQACLFYAVLPLAMAEMTKRAGRSEPGDGVFTAIVDTIIRPIPLIGAVAEPA
jgi:hypothetical protein